MSVTINKHSEELKALVHELSKSNPDADLVKNKTEILGIPYSNDQIILMSEVLVYLSEKTNHKNPLKDKPA